MSTQAVSLLDIYKAPLHGHTLIEASAGTGKTWTISGLYTRLLLDETLNLKVPDILVVTFTRAATAELRDRIRKRLSEVLASFRIGQGLDEFCQKILDNFTGDRERAIRKLTRAVAGFDESAIFTIDGFCQRLLGEAAFEAGAEFSFELVTNERELLNEVTEDFWRLKIHEASGVWLEFLLQQPDKMSPTEWLKPLRNHVGKAKHLWPLSPLADIEKLEKQWQSCLDQLRTQWQQGSESLKAQLTQHNINKKTQTAILNRWQKIEDMLLLTPLTSALLSENCSKDLSYYTASKINNSLNKGAEPFSHPICEMIDSLVKFSTSVAENCDLKMSHLRAELMEWIKTECAKRKALRQQLSFDDLLNQVGTALDGGQGQAFADFIRQRYRAALIDEFQDTNPVQCRIFQSVYAQSGLPLYYVGDPKQSIYAFRGADIRAYLSAKTQVQHEAVQTLSVNQRSVPKLIEAVNTLFGRAEIRAPFIDPGIGFYPVDASKRVQATLNIHEDDGVPFRFLMLPSNPDDPATCWKKDVATDKATEGTANEIARLLSLASQGKALLDGRPLHGGDIAVLVQDSWKAQKIQNALIERSVPSVREAKDSVYASIEAKQLLMVLIAVVQPNRLDFVRTALSTDLMGYSLNTLIAMIEDSLSWDGVLDDFTAWQSLWRDHGFMRFFRRWLDTVGQDGLTVSERLLGFVDGERRLTNVLHLAELIQSESKRAVGQEALITWLAQQINDPQSGEEDDPTLIRLESDAQRVKIVTIHKSKGLEYPIVFCPYLFDSKLPKVEEPVLVHHDNTSWLDLGSPDIDKHRIKACRTAMEENLRLLYVALTRPKHRCYVVWGNVNVLEDITEKTSFAKQLAPGFHTSPLSWLIHPCPDQTDDKDPLFTMRSWCTKYADAAHIQEDIQSLTTQAPEAIGCYELLEGTIQAPPLTESVPDLKPASFDRPALTWGWQVASFSGLTRHVKTGTLSIAKEAPDRDEEAPVIELEERVDPRLQQPSVFNYPLGEIKANVAGTCVHDVLENWNWDQPDTLTDVVERARVKAGLKERWNPILAEIAENTIYTSLTLDGIQLAHVAQKHRLAELEFTFPVSDLSVEVIQELLAHPDHQVAQAFIQASNYLSFETLQGYLRGFIDLVFQANGRFYVLDYKTNWLGNRIEDYHAQTMEEAVANHHYYLQYLLYTVAVHRYLRERIAEYDYEQHMGGVLYLFQRGLGDRSGNYGIHRDRPPLALIEAFDRVLIAREGV